MSKDNRDMHQTGWTTPSLPKHFQEARAELSDQELVTKTLRDHITGEVDLSSAQVQSVNILAKASGMYTTRIEDVTPLSSEDRHFQNTLMVLGRAQRIELHASE